MKYAFIDLETTGVKHWANGILSIAVIIDIDGETKERISFKVSPFPGDLIDDSALEVNGLTKEEIATYPSPSVVFNQLRSIFYKHVDRFSKTDKFFFVGYNARFDNEFIRAFWLKNADKFFGSMFWAPTIDVMDLYGYKYRHQRNEFPNFRLATVYEKVTGKKLENAHDAMSDIEATRELFYLLEQKEGE